MSSSGTTRLAVLLAALATGLFATSSSAQGTPGTPPAPNAGARQGNPNKDKAPPAQPKPDETQTPPTSGDAGGAATPPGPGASTAAPSPQPSPQGEGVTDVPADTEAGENRIVDIRVEGNSRVEAAAVERALVQKRGKAFDPAKTADDLRALWRLGFFSDIQLLVQRLPQGGLVYVVRVEERPSVREVRLEGNKELSKDDFKDQLTIKPNSILDVEAVRESAKKIQEKYVDKGFFLAEVNWHTEKVPETNQVDVVYDIREHSKVRVREISFIGNEHVPSNELKDAMQTKEATFIAFLSGEGTYREEIFQRDLTFVQAAYFDRGFINAKVEKPIVTISPDKKDIFITLKVEEGEQYKIGKLDFSGDLIKSKDDLHKLMSSKEGELFSRTTLIKDLGALTDVYYDAGYAYANINPVTQVHADERTIDLTFDVQKGRQVTIERIEISGNQKTRDKVIRREMRVYEGELFSGTGLRTSQERINALGFFETVEVTHKPGSTDDQIVVNVEVKEKPTGTFQLGLGFSNVEQWVFTLQVQQNNFLGWGQAVSASAQLSSLRNFVQLSYFDPYFLDTPFIFSTDLYRVQADYLGFVRESTGGNVNGGYHFAFDPDLQANLTYTLEQVNVQESTSFAASAVLSNRFRSGLTSALRPSITWDKRDNRLFPSKGFMLFGSVDYAPQFLGGNFNFIRYTAYGRYYKPLPLGAVFKVNVTGGYVQQLDPHNPLPISELYFVGGINTVRGYFLRSITPTTRVGSISSPDTPITDFPIGGDKQFILNAELEFPIFEKVGIRGVVFYDNGNAWGTDAHFFQDPQHPHNFLGLFHSIGFGFRWFSPIGPLRFEWGIPLNPRKNVPGVGDDQPVLFEFTIGNFF